MDPSNGEEEHGIPVINPNQVIPGKAQSFVWNLTNHGLERILFASGSNLVQFLNNQHCIMQPVGFTIGKVAYSNSVDSVIFCSSNGVYEMNMDHFSDKVCIVQYSEEYQIRFFTCSPIGELLVISLSKGDSFFMDVFRNDGCKWNQIFRIETPSLISKISCSYDDRHIATIFDSDPLVRIWYFDEDNLNYFLLNHPKNVTDFEWKSKDIQEIHLPNVLMTTCEDRIQRFWMDGSEYGDSTFYACLTFPRRSHDSVVKILSTPLELSPNRIITQRIKSCQQNAHSISLDGIESSTWVICMEPDGSIEIKLICGLGDLPQRTPSQSTWLRHDGILAEIDFRKVKSSRLFYSSDPNQKNDLDPPQQLTLYILSNDGTLTNWTISFNNIPSLKLFNRYTGHESQITRIVTHPSLPLVATMDDSGNLIGWHIRDSAYFSPKDMLTNIQEEVSLFANLCWHPQKPILFGSSSRGIELLSVKSTSPQQHNLSQEFEFSTYPPLPSYYTFRKVDQIIPNSELFSKCVFLESFVLDGSSFIVALTDDGETLKFWELGENHSFNCTLEKEFMDDSITSAHIVSNIYFNTLYEKQFILLVFGTEEGRILIYQCNPLKKVMELWKRFEASSKDIVIVRICDIPSRLLSVDEDRREILVWECESSTKFQKEDTLSFDEEILDCQWIDFGNAQNILVVTTMAGMVCFSQGRSFKKGFGQWNKCCRFSSYNNLISQRISITKDNTIIASIGSQLQLFTKWMDDKNSSIFVLEVLKSHRKKPDYHPDLLQIYLMENQFSLVRNIFAHVAKCLKNSNPKSKDIQVPALSLSLFDFVEDEPDQVRTKQGSFFDKFKPLELSDSDSESDSDIDPFMNSKFGKVDIPKQENLPPKQTSKISTTDPMDDDDFSEIYEIIMDNISSKKLAEITSKEQMHFLALLEVFQHIESKPEALDSCAARLFVESRISKCLARSYNSRILPIKFPSIAWAMHSETQNQLLDMILQSETNFDWVFLKNLGCTFWISNHILLKECAERLGKNQFAVKKDPADCALTYIAMKKLPLLVRLYEKRSKMQIAKFLSRTFNPEARKSDQENINCVLSIKNAYKLLGKHQYEYAAAFFLLGGAIDDCTDILINRLNDVQLAYFILRLYLGDHHPKTVQLLSESIIPAAKSSQNTWLESIALWRQKKMAESLDPLITTRSQKSFDSSVFAYCDFVSKLPHVKSQSFQEKKKSVLLSVAYSYCTEGMYFRALQCLKRLEKQKGFIQESNPGAQYHSESIDSGMLDMSAFGMSNQSSSFQQSKKAEILEIEDVSSELLDSIKFKIATSIMTQNLFDGRNFSVDLESFNSFSVSISKDLQFIAQEIQINQSLIEKKLGAFTKLNGLMLGRCFISPVEEFPKLLEKLNRQLVSFLSLYDHEDWLSEGRLDIVNSWIKDFVLCIEKCVEQEIEIPKGLEYVATLYTLLYLCSLLEKNYGHIRVLFSMFPLISADGTLCTLELLPNLYKGFKKSCQEEDASVEAMKEVLKDCIKSDCSTQIHWSLLHALVSIELSDIVNGFLQKGNEKFGGDYVNSLSSQTLLSTIKLWTSFHDKKLKYLEYEKVSKLPTFSLRSFRNVHTMSIESQLNELVKTLMFSQKKRKLRTSTTFLETSPLYHYTITKAAVLEFILSLMGRDFKDSECFDHDLSCKSLWDYFIKDLQVPNIEESIYFSDYMEIVKSKESIKSFCINWSDRNVLAFGTSKCIREIRIDDSIRFRKRNSTGEKLLDDEASTWNESLNRFHDLTSMSPATPLVAPGNVSQLMEQFMKKPDSKKPETTIQRRSFEGIANDHNEKKKNRFLKKRQGRTRRPSFTSRDDPFSSKVTSEIDRNMSVSILCSHPFLPFYLTGDSNGCIHLFQFGIEFALKTFQKSGPAITHLAFSRFGYKFGATNDNGELLLYRFEGTSDYHIEKMDCHQDRANGFTFLESGSLVATIGLSHSIKELCLWDLLLPNHLALMHRHVFEEEPNLIKFNLKYNYLIIGSRKTIYLYDLTQKVVFETIKLNGILEDICVDVAGEFFVACFVDGITVYDTNPQAERLLYNFPQNPHKKQGLFEQSAIVKSVLLPEFLLTGGTDGRILSYRAL